MYNKFFAEKLLKQVCDFRELRRPCGAAADLFGPVTARRCPPKLTGAPPPKL